MSSNTKRPTIAKLKARIKELESDVANKDVEINTLREANERLAVTIDDLAMSVEANVVEDDDDSEAEDVDDGDFQVHTILSLSLVHEILEYIHIDFKNIIHREGNAFFDDDESRLPLSLIMNSGLEDYFELVLLSDRYRDVLCDECAKRGQLDSLKWARSKGYP